MNDIITAYKNTQDLPLSTASHVDLFDAFMWACEHNEVSLWNSLKTTSLNPLQGQGLPLVVAIENQSMEMVEDLAPIFRPHLLKVLRYFLWSKRDELHALTNPTTRAQYLSVLLPHALYYTPHKDLAHIFVSLNAEECKQLPVDQYLSDEFLLGLIWLYDLHCQNPSIYPDPIEKTTWVLSNFSFDTQKQINDLMGCACKSLCIESFKEILNHFKECEVSTEVLLTALSQLDAQKAVDVLEMIAQYEFSEEVAHDVVEGVLNSRFRFRMCNFTQALDQRVITTLLPYLTKVKYAASHLHKDFWRFFVHKSSYKMMVWFEEQKGVLGLPNVSWDDFQNTSRISYATDPHFKIHPQLHQKVIINKSGVDSKIFALPAEHWLDPHLFDALVASENMALIDKALTAGAVLSLEHFQTILLFADPATKKRLFVTHILPHHTAQSIVEQLHHGQRCVMNFLTCDVSALEMHTLSEDQQQGWVMAALENNRWDWLDKTLSTNPSIKDVWAYCAQHPTDEFLIPALDIVLRHCDPWQNNSQAFIEAVKANNLPMAQYLAPHCDPTSNNSIALSIAIEESAKHAQRTTMCNWETEEDALEQPDPTEEMVDFLLRYCHPRADNAKALKTALRYNLPQMVLKLLMHFPRTPKLKNLTTCESELLDQCLAQKQAQVLRSTVQLVQTHHPDKKRVM